MAKRTERDFKKACRAAAQDGMMNSADGKWIRVEGAMGSHQQAGYKVGEYDHPRKKKEDKTGACRNWAPNETFRDRGLDRRGRR